MRAFLCCSECGEFFRDETVPQDRNKIEARAAATRHGWRCGLGKHKVRDLCPECAGVTS